MTLFSIALLLGVAAISVNAQSPLYGQCGGIGWTGSTACAAGSVCEYSNPYYSQCLPGTASTTTTTKTTSTTTTSSTTTKTSSTTTTTSSTSTPSPTGKLRFAGVNISGFDFGCGTDGTCNITQTYPPLVQYTGIDGAGQMQHFVNDDGFNIFRLPVAWQFLIGNANTAGSTLNAANFAEYNTLVQACLSTGAHCIIDIHNYARFNGEIVGQGGPANSVLAGLWGNIATQYASTANVVFGVMNEPHDIPDITTWATTVQACVTAIRTAGATSQIILLPGNDYTSAEQFVSDGSGPALLSVVNLDGTTTNLIFDVHKYLDSDNSGTHSDCVTNNIADAWEPLATWLRQNGRQALNTETGGGNVADCTTFMCQQIAYQAQNSDVILGYIGWAAGSFATSYVLSEVPTKNGNTWTDTSLVQTCLAPISGSQQGSTS